MSHIKVLNVASQSMIVGAKTFLYMTHQELLEGEHESEEQSSSQDPTPPTPQGPDHQGPNQTSGEKLDGAG